MISAISRRYGPHFLFFFIILFIEIAFRSVDCGHTDKFHEKESDENVHLNDRHGDLPEHSIKLFAVNFSHVKFPFVLSISLFLLGIAKLGFHHASYLSSIFPESCLLIVVGFILSLVIHWTGAQNDFVFQPRVFFLYLLPPIMLEAAFSLHDRAVWENIGTILTFACVGTVLNTFIIAPFLFLFNDAGIFGDDARFSFPQCLLFSALISAVDPVAVLAIFEQIHVNAALYFIVFGESLLNDAMTVVLYRMMEVFVALPEIPMHEVLKGCCSFVLVSLGGVVFGTSCGLLTSFLTKFTLHARVIEPLIIFSGAYFSYLLAECFESSGIVSIICCVVTIAQYAFANISRKSQTVVVCCSKMFSSVCDCVIFLFLGMEFTEFMSGLATGSLEQVSWAFVLASLVLCILTRFAIVTSFSYLLNMFRVRKISRGEQFIMGFGGLRGAVSFSLVKLLDGETVHEKNSMMTATLVIILFTVFLQGMTMKPIVRCLKVQMQNKTDPTMNEAINITLIDHVMTGLEEIVGHVGDHRFKDWFDRCDQKYFRPLLQREPVSVDDQLMALYADIMLREHRAHIEACRNKVHILSTSSTAVTPFSVAAPNSLQVPENISVTSSRRGSSKTPPLLVTPLPLDTLAGNAGSVNTFNDDRFEVEMQQMSQQTSRKSSRRSSMHRVEFATNSDLEAGPSRKVSIQGSPVVKMTAVASRLQRLQRSKLTFGAVHILHNEQSDESVDEVFEASKMFNTELKEHMKKKMSNRGFSDGLEDVIKDVYLRRRRATTVHLGGADSRSRVNSMPSTIDPCNNFHLHHSTPFTPNANLTTRSADAKTCERQRKRLERARAVNAGPPERSDSCSLRSGFESPSASNSTSFKL